MTPIGIDLVAMLRQRHHSLRGQTTFLFLDYFAAGKLDVQVAVDVVKGIAKGCEISKCSLIGGETRRDCPGCIGRRVRSGWLRGGPSPSAMTSSTASDIRVGNKLIGLASSGVHSNGYSLVRKIFFEETKTQRSMIIWKSWAAR